MATSFSCTQTFAASPGRVWSLITDPEYIVAKGVGSGAVEVSPEVRADGEHTLVISRRRMHVPDSFPGLIKKFTGDSLIINETQKWGPAGEDGSRAGTFVIDFGGQPLAFHGELSLQGDDTGTEVITSATLKASVPIVGRKAEGIARDWTQRYLSKEEEIAAQWLAG